MFDYFPRHYYIELTILKWKGRYIPEDEGNGWRDFSNDVSGRIRLIDSPEIDVPEPPETLNVVVPDAHAVLAPVAITEIAELSTPPVGFSRKLNAGTVNVAVALSVLS